jgi:hypothetical protein
MASAPRFESPDYESGGGEFESLRAPVLFNSLGIFEEGGSSIFRHRDTLGTQKTPAPAACLGNYVSDKYRQQFGSFPLTATGRPLLG